MTCSQRSHMILVYCLLVMVHVQQTVNSLQDEFYRHLGTNHLYRHNPLPFRDDDDAVDSHHHRRHEHHHLQQLHQFDPDSNPMKSNKIHPKPHQKYMPPRFGTRRIEEAVHAFRSTSTLRPAVTSPDHHYTSKSRTDNREPHRKSSPWIVNNRRPSIMNVFPIIPSTTVPPTPSPTFFTRTTSSPAIQLSVAGMGYGRGRVPAAGVHQQRLHSDTSGNDGNQSNDDDYYYYADDDDDDDDDDDNENADEDADAYDSTNGNGDAADDNGGYLTNSETNPDGYIDPDNLYQSDEPTGGLGSITEQKLRNFSTPEDVAKQARAYDPRFAVQAHIQRVLRDAECKYPRAKVVPIPSEASKSYLPHCTLLHRCDNDTGCCKSESSICTMKREVTVDLDFYMFELGKYQGIRTLTLVNHTECHCVNRIRYQSSRTTTEPPDVTTERPTQQTNQCVKDFDPIFESQDPGYISCDCVNSTGERKENCEIRKRGEEAFSLDDRRCISRHQCLPPVCEYGQYNTTSGRCPGIGYKIQTAQQIKPLG